MPLSRPAASASRPSVLVAHPWMGRGGSEATAMWTLQALQDDYRVVFTTASPFDLSALNGLYGTAVSARKVAFLPAPGLPGVRSGTRLVHWQRARFERFCRKIASRFDLCVSAYNPIHFGKPGIQLIGDLSFSERSRLLLYPNAEDQFCHRQSLLRRAYLALGECLHGRRRPPLAERGDCAVANSFWTADQLQRIFDLPASLPVLYPPCAFGRQAPSANEVAREPLGFVCLGRISPEKEIESVIEILEQVRRNGHPVTLDIAGRFGDDAYGHRIRRLAEKRSDWIRLPGFLAATEKRNLFRRRTFALHACRVEAFGIAVAEMAAAGLVPFVPTEGGAGEIVPVPELQFGDRNEAVGRICELIESPGKVALYRETLTREVERFQPGSFMEGLRSIISNFRSGEVSPEPFAEALSSSHVAEDPATTR